MKQTNSNGNSTYFDDADDDDLDNPTISKWYDAQVNNSFHFKLFHFKIPLFSYKKIQNNSLQFQPKC